MSILNFLNTKAKAFVVFLFSLIALVLFILSTLVATAICKESYGLIIGIALMILAILLHCAGKKHYWGYLSSFLINAIANGFSVSAYYFSANIEMDLYHLFFAVIPAVGILFLVYVMLQTFHKTKRVTVTIACIVNALLILTLMVLWIMHGYVIFSFGFFCSLISFFYLCVFGITINHDERSVLRDISFGSFGSFIILTVVVIFILSEGEILDGFDVPDLELGKAKNKKKK